MAEADSLFGGAFRGELEDVSVELERIETLADGVARSLSTALRGAALDGKSLQGVLAGVARSFADIALKAALQPLSGLVSGALEGLFAATNPALGGVTPFAKGGVIATPSYFPLGQGLGLAGEAGPEAILPLQRGPDGRLGVAGAGGGTITVQFAVTSPDARSFVSAEAEVSAMLLRAVRRGQRGS